MRVPAQGINNKAKQCLFCFAYASAIPHLNCCANPFRLSTYKSVPIPVTHITHLPSLISTHLQIPFVCQLTKLGQYQETTSAHVLYALTNATLSTKTTNFPERSLCRTEPTRMHATHWYLQCFFQYPTVGVDFFRSCSKNLIIQCPYAELSTAIAAHSSKN